MLDARADGKRVCLPMIDPRRPGKMHLGRVDPGTMLLPNRFGILEPCRRSAVRVPLNRVDAVMVPLVAFDDNGNRLGMGAGYYDRLLRRRQALVGLRLPEARGGRDATPGGVVQNVAVDRRCLREAFCLQARAIPRCGTR